MKHEGPSAFLKVNRHKLKHKCKTNDEIQNYTLPLIINVSSYFLKGAACRMIVIAPLFGIAQVYIYLTYFHKPVLIEPYLNLI